MDAEKREVIYEINYDEMMMNEKEKLFRGATEREKKHFAWLMSEVINMINESE